MLDNMQFENLRYRLDNRLGSTDHNNVLPTGVAFTLASVSFPNADGAHPPIVESVVSPKTARKIVGDYADGRPGTADSAFRRIFGFSVEEYFEEEERRVLGKSRSGTRGFVDGAPSRDSKRPEDDKSTQTIVQPPPPHVQHSLPAKEPLFSRPLSRDPIAWIGGGAGALGCIAAMFNPNAVLLDGLVGGLICFLIGGIFPAFVRRRTQRTGRVQVSQATDTKSDMEQAPILGGQRSSHKHFVEPLARWDGNSDDAPEGFYPDGTGVLRYWDGTDWGQRTKPIPPSRQNPDDLKI